MSTPRQNIQGDREPMHQTLQWISDPDGVERARTGWAYLVLAWGPWWRHQTLQWISDPDGADRVGLPGLGVGAMVEASNQESAAAGIPLSTPIKSERILR